MLSRGRGGRGTPPLDVKRVPHKGQVDVELRDPSSFQHVCVMKAGDVLMQSPKNILLHHHMVVDVRNVPVVVKLSICVIAHVLVGQHFEALFDDRQGDCEGKGTSTGLVHATGSREGYKYYHAKARAKQISHMDHLEWRASIGLFRAEQKKGGGECLVGREQSIA